LEFFSYGFANEIASVTFWDTEGYFGVDFFGKLYRDNSDVVQRFSPQKKMIVWLFIISWFLKALSGMEMAGMVSDLNLLVD
jgi:hypothetical protein